MSSFTDVLLVSPLDDGKNWIIMRDFSYVTNGYRTNNKNQYSITVPRGFITDFASIPRPLWWLFPKWGKYGNAAVIHDWLYWNQNIPRKKADLILYKAMTTLDVDKLSKRLIYLAVRICGGCSWSENEKLKKTAL